MSSYHVEARAPLRTHPLVQTHPQATATNVVKCPVHPLTFEHADSPRANGLSNSTLDKSIASNVSRTWFAVGGTAVSAAEDAGDWVAGMSDWSALERSCSDTRVSPRLSIATHVDRK